MKYRMKTVFGLTGCLMTGLVQASGVDELLAQYASAGPFDISRGAQLWKQEYPGANGPRACTTCHTNDPRQAGRHAVTGKAIEPLAPSVNSKRLKDRAEIEKWLGRNCKWTLGRECTPREQGDLLSFLKTQ